MQDDGAPEEAVGHTSSKPAGRLVGPHVADGCTSLQSTGWQARPYDINQKSNGMICIDVAIGQKASTVVTEALETHGAMDCTIVVSAPASSSAPMHYIAPMAAKEADEAEVEAVEESAE